MSNNKSRHAYLREDFRDKCEDYFRAVTQTGYDREEYARRLAATALKLHLFEQGMRGKP